MATGNSRNGKVLKAQVIKFYADIPAGTIGEVVKEWVNDSGKWYKLYLGKETVQTFSSFSNKDFVDMEPNKEKLVKAFKEHSFETTVYGVRASIIPKDEWSALADQILSAFHLHSDIAPPLQQAGVMRPLAHSADKCLQCGWDIEDCTCPDGYNGAGANGA